MLTACTISEEAVNLPSGGKVPVMFASGFEITPTKAGGTDGSLWSLSDTVGVYMVENGETLDKVVDGAANKPYKVAIAGFSTTDLLPAGDTIYFPAAGKVNFILYYPYTLAISNNNYPVSLSDQSDQEAIDLMYVHDLTPYDKRTTGKVDVTFAHQLAQLVFRIGKGGGIPTLSGLTFDIEGVALQTDFDLATGQLADPGLGGSSLLSAHITPLTNDSMMAEAIVLPVLNVQAANIVLHIKVVSGREYTAILPPVPGLPGIDAGNRYTYTVSLGEHDLTLSGTLTPWTSVDGGQANFKELPVTPVPIDWALVNNGTFHMGSPTTEPDRQANETQHQVTLTGDYFMSKYEITNTQYAAFLNGTGVDYTGTGTVDGFGTQTLVVADAAGVAWSGSDWQPASGKADHPVIQVTWYGAKAFADWIGGSLPTEAQWEYACRAGTQTAWSFGDDATSLDNYAWYSSNSGSETHPVGQKRSNIWGLYDMYGNVWEWLSDWYEADLGTAPVTDPTGPATGATRVGRGGNYGDLPSRCRSASRSDNPPVTNRPDLGFRVVYDAP